MGHRRHGKSRFYYIQLLQVCWGSCFSFFTRQPSIFPCTFSALTGHCNICWECKDIFVWKQGRSWRSDTTSHRKWHGELLVRATVIDGIKLLLWITIYLQHLLPRNSDSDKSTNYNLGSSKLPFHVFFHDSCENIIQQIEKDVFLVYTFL